MNEIIFQDFLPFAWLDRVCFIMALIISLRLISKDIKHKKIILKIISLIYALSTGLYVVFGIEMLGIREIN